MLFTGQERRSQMPSENKVWSENGIASLLVSVSLRGIASPNVIYETLVLNRLILGRLERVLLVLIVVTAENFDKD
ncbi:hypothetical protein BCON_0097g00250 [Botryotinia convoluta]|uniref:Uncharacterized protein n=1 Tax=Botryotinia convoluta TaxID=54673 RepID=A0A4Z1I0H8_9HELO|nr:hypothetical protein BCON_0097g00250 [Botryotinia convoluta]